MTSHGKSQLNAFELAANAANHVLAVTKQKEVREIAIIDSQDWLIKPNLQYRATPLL